MNPFAEAADVRAVVNAGRNGIDTPVDEHPEARFAPPLHAGVALFLGFIGAGRRRRLGRLGVQGIERVRPR